MNRSATSTPAPGRLAARLSSPYTTDTDRPWAAPSPAAPKAQAVAPSRGPQPATFSGSAIASRASTISGSSTPAGAVTPAARAASRNIARNPTSTAADDSSTPAQTPGPGGRPDSPAASRPAAAGPRRRRTATTAASPPPRSATTTAPVTAGRAWAGTAEGDASSSTAPTATRTT
ncbi:hypothetical protein A4V12_18010 [Streptomyces noursei]|nr:hypothetical protein A4V12_18010 [Streptomyces noursei]